MKTYTVTYSPDKAPTPDQTTALTADIEGKTYTDVYLIFMIKYPKNCEIIDIKEKSNA